jgi:competence protein ComEA
MKRGIVIIISFLTVLTFFTALSGAEALKKDINKATIEDLVKVKGIGQKRAKLIVEFLQKRGGITDLDELLQVKGIGPKILDKIKEQFEVNDSYKGDIYQKGEDSTYRSIKGMGRTGKQNPS